MSKTYIHIDSLNQPIQVGQPIAFTSSYLQGVKVGIVEKLTAHRVKIRYRYSYYNQEKQLCRGSYVTQIAPSRTISLGEELPQHLTMFMLKNGN